MLGYEILNSSFSLHHERQCRDPHVKKSKSGNDAATLKNYYTKDEKMSHSVNPQKDKLDLSLRFSPVQVN